jgi:hypothetical protein
VEVKTPGLRLGRIEDELIDVQRHFPAINAVLNLRRDDFTDVVRQNMIAAYEFLDAVVRQSVDLFSDEGLEALLQLNHLVLLGRGYDPRAYGRHISTTPILANTSSPSAGGIASMGLKTPTRSRRRFMSACSASRSCIRRGITALGP